MNYSAHYSSLIYKAKNRCVSASEFTERHHIITKCLGGTNKKKWEDTEYRNFMVAARNKKRINSPEEWAEICRRRGKKIKEGKSKAKEERLNP